MARIMASRAAATVSLLTMVTADQCRVQHVTYNCWGEDLKGEPAESYETCCQRCSEIPECEVFTFDTWNISGDAQPYCFFKYGCSDPKPTPDTAISGILRWSSTDEPTKAPQTTHAPTTVTSKAPTTTPSTEPQCTAPSPVTAVDLGGAKQLNVSRWEECCSTCEAPACSYVAFGKYQGVSEETVACFHFAEPAGLGAVRGSQFLVLRDDNAASCEDLGLEGCGASPVSSSPKPLPPSPLPSPAVLAAAGAGVFVVTVPMGYFLSRVLRLGK